MRVGRRAGSRCLRLGHGGRSTRLERIEAHERNPKWKNPPLRIEMSECINCDACLRHCPTQFGAIFNHGADVVIVPSCAAAATSACPRARSTASIPIPSGARRRSEWWSLPLSKLDPYK